MTEAEWLACEQPGPMLAFVRGSISDRKLRLFACACARSVWRFVPPGPCREAFEVGRRHADGLATDAELAAARAAAIAVADADRTRAAAAWAACETAEPSALRAARAAADQARDQIRQRIPQAAADEARAQAAILRDIINPFRTVTDGELRRLGTEPIVREIAEEVYAGGPQENMPALAAELERLGWVDLGVLRHCSEPGAHVRGCWVIDGLLGRDAPPEPAPLPVLVPEVVSPIPAAPDLIAPPPATPVSPRVLAARVAFEEHLGPKKFRRAVRKAVGSTPSVGAVNRTEEWNQFIAIHPEHDLTAEELVGAFAVCTVHACRLVSRAVVPRAEDSALMRDPRYLEARAANFPHSFAEDGTDDGPERIGWWCSQCQLARREWMNARA